MVQKAINVAGGDGTAVPAGFVGELIGTLRAGTGGNSYSARASTSFNNTATSLISATLNKGNYLILAACNVQNDGVARNVYYAGRIGGVNVTNTDFMFVGATGVLLRSFCMFTAQITADSTSVDVIGQFNSAGTSSNHSQEMHIIKLPG
jgi:hypothetical protein